MMDIFEYIAAHISPEPEFLHRLDRESHLRMVHGRMCSGHLQGRLLKMLTLMARPGTCSNWALSPVMRPFP